MQSDHRAYQIKRDRGYLVLPVIPVIIFFCLDLHVSSYKDGVGFSQKKSQNKK